MSSDNNPSDKLSEVLGKALTQTPDRSKLEEWAKAHEINAEDVQRIFLILNSMTDRAD